MSKFWTRCPRFFINKILWMNSPIQFKMVFVWEITNLNYFLSLQHLLWTHCPPLAWETIQNNRRMLCIREFPLSYRLEFCVLWGVNATSTMSNVLRIVWVLKNQIQQNLLSIWFFVMFKFKAFFIAVIFRKILILFQFNQFHRRLNFALIEYYCNVINIIHLNSIYFCNSTIRQ